jgi:hypothetical protein
VPILLLLCITYCGCSTSYIVTPTQGEGDYSYSDLASEFDTKEAYIILKGGSETLGSQIRVNADSLYWTDPPLSKYFVVGGKHHVVAVNEVQRISRTNHLIGALEGLGFGLLASAFVRAMNTGVDSGDPGFAFALIVGVTVGYRFEYNFPVDSTATKNK